MGLFGESYLLFSIGTLQPIWDVLYPDCFVSRTTCSAASLHRLTYAVVLGIILGMLLLGFLAGTLGRRTGSLLTSALMALGSLGLTLVATVFAGSNNSSNDTQFLVNAMTCCLFLFGIGVGGEYPLSVSSASERAMLERQQQQQQQQQQNSRLRGQRVQLVFTMQGMGIFANCLVLMILLVLFGQAPPDGDGRDGGYSTTALLQIWRFTYAIGAILLAGVFGFRFLYLKESQIWKEDQRRIQEEEFERRQHDAKHPPQRQQRRQQSRISTPKETELTHIHPMIRMTSSVSSLSIPSTVMASPSHDNDLDDRMLEPNEDDINDRTRSPTYLLFRDYGWRLFGASMSWLLWDISFYGNKLFQSTFLLAITGSGASLMQLSSAAALNALVALFGYLAAALLLDHPLVGRFRLQQAGFMITGSLFILCGLSYTTLGTPALLTLYFLTSFFGQCGPNATTFLLPAELVPTSQRTLCHGIAAASGKLGALFAAAVFPLLRRQADLFLCSGYASFAAFAVTAWTLPDNSQLELGELDQLWRMTLRGNRSGYRGPANQIEFLSLQERYQRMVRRHPQPHQEDDCS